MSRRADLPPEILRRASRIRGGGYAIAGAAVLFIAYCLVGSVLSALEDGVARDPYTGVRVAELDASCGDWAERLLGVEGEAAESAPYHVQVTSWRWRCSHIESAAARDLAARWPRLRLR